jgi:hypothetical protein
LASLRLRPAGSGRPNHAGIFGANATASVFENEFSVMGMEPTRIIGTPAPIVAAEAAAA